MSSNGFASESVGIEREAVGSESELAGAVSAPDQLGGVSVKEAAAHLGMPVSTMYDWVNRRWVRTIVGLSERGKEQRLVPWSEIERLKGGAKETLLQQSSRNLDTGSDREPAGNDPEPARTDSEATGSGSEAVRPDPETTGSGSEPVGTEPVPVSSGSESTGSGSRKRRSGG
jgi:hypothetical protein